MSRNMKCINLSSVWEIFFYGITFWSFAEHVFHIELSLTVVPTKSDSDVILCLELLSKTQTRTLHLS